MWRSSTGDGWARCARGHRHWGRHGASGLLLHTASAAGSGVVLLQHRAAWSHHGGTWGLPGGARLSAQESAQRAALRETAEEVQLDLTGITVTAVHCDDHGGWSYATVIARLAEPRAVAPAADETQDVRWVPVRDVTALPLHPGFAATWPVLLDRLADA